MKTIGCGILGLAVAGTSFVSVPSAKADDWSFSIGTQGRWVEPVYVTQPRTIVIPAQYEDRTRQVWREPIYEDRRTLVEIPPRTEIRMMPKFIHGRFAGYDRQVVVVESGRKEWRTERVLVHPGRWETVVERVLIAPERTQTAYEQVMVQAGYWETGPGISIGYRDRDDDDGPRRVYMGPRGVVRVRR